MEEVTYKQHTGLLSPWVDGMRVRKVTRRVPERSSVLDLGCGSGLLLSVLPVGCSYTGVDQDNRVIEMNARRFPQHRFHCVDVTKDPLPFSGPQFDVVVIAAFLEHVENIQFLLKETGRVLKGGGSAVVTTPSGLGGWVHDILAHLGLLSRDAAEEHKGFWTADSLEKNLNSTGLKLASKEFFQCGLNQLFILKKGG
jgi:SAM-dependent methyltransferase